MIFLRWLMRLGPTNPVAVRLVHNASSRTKHMYVRTGYLAVLMVVLLWSLLVQAGSGQLSYRQLAASGATSFSVTAYLQIALICLLAPLFMAGAIAQEANPRTWDILLTTPLSATQIVLGNLLGRLYLILALLVSSLPLFALTQYFGGVPGRTVLQSYVIAACAALLVGAIAITMSVSRIAGRRSVLFFYIAVVSYLAITWVADQSLRGTSGQVTWLTPLNPFLVQESLLNPSRYSPYAVSDMTQAGALQRMWFTSPVRALAVWSVLLSAGLIAGGSMFVRTIAAQGGTLWNRSGNKSARARAARTVWKNPIAWREASTRASTLIKRIARWSFLALGVGWGVVLLVMHHSGGLSNIGLRQMLMATLITETAIIVLLALNMSATSVSREREDGTLDLLLTTPITPRAYISGKLRGLIAFLLPLLAVPAATIALAGGYVALDGLGAPNGVEIANFVGAARVQMPIIMPAGALLYPFYVLPFVAFCVMVGLHWSVKSKGTVGAAVGTIGIVGAVTSVVGLCGWQAGISIPVVGPILASLTPATAIFILGDPAAGATETLAGASNSLASLRNVMFVGAGVATAIYMFVVWAMLTSMVKSFDMTVRKLAGVK